MKRNLLIALAIGAFISTALLVLDQLTGSELAFMDWEMPGISAAYLFWGVTGGPAFMGIAVCWIVNAIVYAVPAVAVPFAFKLLAQALRSKQAA